MEDHDTVIDLSVLCRFCDFNSYQLPDIEGMTPDQRRHIEALCKLCVESFKLRAVNG